MWERKSLCAGVGAVGALVLLLGGLVGASVVSAQDVSPESEDAPTGGVWASRPGLFDVGRGGNWAIFDTVAEELGLTPEELLSQMHDGKRLEEIAGEQGADLEAV